MGLFFTPNIDLKGRLVRGLMGLALIIGAFWSLEVSAWLAGLLTVGGLFGLFEAFRGWCLARACGLKTKL